MEKEKAIEEICEHTNEFQNALLSALDVLEDESEHSAGKGVGQFTFLECVFKSL